MAFADANIRLATPADAAAIAHVHHESTLATYRALFSNEWLNRRSLYDRIVMWGEWLLQSITVVGCDNDGTVVGFASGGVERSGELGVDGELQTLYLLPSAQRQGLGGLLFRRFVLELRSRGYRSMALWVLGENSARKFYESLGGTVIATKQVERDGKVWEDVAYGWKDLTEIRD